MPHWSLNQHSTDFYHNRWSDCTEWKFTKWDVEDLGLYLDQQPDGHGKEDCLQFRWGAPHLPERRDGWHDVACRFKKKYVCSRKLCGTGKGQEPASTRLLTRTLGVLSISVYARNSATKIFFSFIFISLRWLLVVFVKILGKSQTWRRNTFIWKRIS